MSKQLQFNARAHLSIRRGVDTLANAVKVTIGPKGRNVVLDHPLETPNILNDGVAIARGIDLEEPFTNMIVQLFKEVAIKTNDLVGDGTTTATILVQAMVTEGFKCLAAGANPMLLLKGLERGTEILLEEIKALSRPVATHAEIAQVAAIASNDAGVGVLIADVLGQVGRDGSVIIEAGSGLRSEVAYIKGMQFDRGYISPYMVNNQERMEAALSNSPLLITDKKIQTIAELLPLLERLIERGQKELLLIAEDIEGEALTALVMNKARGIFHVVGIRTPGFGDRREAILQDIAIMAGGKVISEKDGCRLEDATIEDLGYVSSVLTTKNATILVDGAGDKALIRSRLQELRLQLASATGDYEREKLRERLANLGGGVGIVKVGAATEMEMKEYKLRIQDALAATRAALEDGVVPGGGVALVLAQSALKRVKVTLPEEVMGVNILRRALEEPLRQIARNAGFEGSVVVADVRARPCGYGFDASNGCYVDMFQAGIVDPTKVTCAALQNAVGIASLLLTTDTLITDRPVHIPNFKDIEFGL